MFMSRALSGSLSYVSVISIPFLTLSDHVYVKKSFAWNYTYAALLSVVSRATIKRSLTIATKL